LSRRDDRPFRIGVLVALPLAAFALFAAVALFARQQSEARIRTAQFCRVLKHQYAQQDLQLRQTRAFLKTPGGREHTVLNDYIRKVSLPRLELDVRTRQPLPPACR
jgi:hypothetical protein